jgi:hypothetical protein
MSDLLYVAKVRITLSALALFVSFAFMEVDHRPIVLRILLVNACALDAILCAAVLFWSGIPIPRRRKTFIFLATGFWIGVQSIVASLLPVR